MIFQMIQFRTLGTAISSKILEAILKSHVQTAKTERTACLDVQLEEKLFYVTEKKENRMKARDINIGDIFETNNYGKFKIIAESDKRRRRSKCYDIEFLDTGSTRKDIRKTEILRGEIKDYYRPSIAGVGYLGEGIMQKDHKREYSIWKHMLHRCYNINDDNYKKYGAKGVTVCDRWMCFKNFVEDIPFIDGYDEQLFKEGKIQLDKDLKCNDFPKEYNKYDCTFLSPEENLKISEIQKNYKIVKFNLEKFHYGIIAHGTNKSKSRGEDVS